MTAMRTCRNASLAAPQRNRAPARAVAKPGCTAALTGISHQPILSASDKLSDHNYICTHAKSGVSPQTSSEWPHCGSGSDWFSCNLLVSASLQLASNLVKRTCPRGGLNTVKHAQGAAENMNYLVGTGASRGGGASLQTDTRGQPF